MDLVAISDNNRQKSFYDKSISVSIMWDADEKKGITEISIFIVIHCPGIFVVFVTAQEERRAWEHWTWMHKSIYSRAQHRQNKMKRPENGTNITSRLKCGLLGGDVEYFKSGVMAGFEKKFLLCWTWATSCFLTSQSIIICIRFLGKGTRHWVCQECLSAKVQALISIGKQLCSQSMFY